MGFEVVCLVEGEIDRKLIALCRRLQLQEEGVGTGLVPSTDILRQTGIARAANPSFLPTGGLHLFHPPYHHFGKAVKGCLTTCA